MERHRECAQAGWCGKAVCDVVWLHYTNLELPQAQVFPLCLLSLSGNFTQVERKELSCGFADLHGLEQQHCLMLLLLKSMPMDAAWECSV